MGSERPVLRTGSITLLRYVSLPLRPGTLRQGMGVVVRQTQTVESGRPRRHPPIACYAARRALALSLAAQLR